MVAYSGRRDADPDEVVQRMTKPAGRGTPYHDHPIVNKLDRTVFRASEGFIRFCLAPRKATPVGKFDGPIAIDLPPASEVPTWNTQTGELHFHGRLIKKFTKPAPNQRKVLDESSAEVGERDRESFYEGCKSRLHQYC